MPLCDQGASADPRPASLIAALERCVRSAGDYLSGVPDVPVVGARDRFTPVTDIGASVERHLARSLRAAYPGSAVVGPGGPVAAGTNGVTFYADAVSGDGNFLRALPVTAISVAVAAKGRLAAGCVLDVDRDECFIGGPGLPLRAGHAARTPATAAAPAPLVITDLPRPGSADRPEVRFFAELLGEAEIRRIRNPSLALAWVASGRADAACGLGAAPAEIAAGVALVRSSGGVHAPIGDPESDPYGIPLPPELAPGYAASAPNARARRLGRSLAERLTGLAADGR